jgi:SHS2 domain-containing protein
LQEAFENVGLCMFNYMTPLEGIKYVDDRTIVAEGHDLPSLLYHWLDELLFSFATDFFVPTSLKIISLQRGDAESQQPNRPESDPNAPEERSSGSRWRIEAKGEGEVFDRRRHASGTEIKAITYSAMQINESEGDAEVFVIVDI